MLPHDHPTSCTTRTCSLTHAHAPRRSSGHTSSRDTHPHLASRTWSMHRTHPPTHTHMKSLRTACTTVLTTHEPWSPGLAAWLNSMSKYMWQGWSARTTCWAQGVCVWTWGCGSVCGEVWGCRRHNTHGVCACGAVLEAPPPLQAPHAAGTGNEGTGLVAPTPLIGQHPPRSEQQQPGRACAAQARPPPHQVRRALARSSPGGRPRTATHWRS